MNNYYSNLKHDLRTFISNYEWGIYFFKIIPENRELVVEATTDIVIEGYPRSANTFSVVAFQLAQPGVVKIAHHLHASGQILRAKSFGIPAVLLIREPLEAIVSLKIRHPELQVQKCLRDYLSFYSSLKHIKSYPVIADFKSVTEDFGSVINRVNERFGTEFYLFNNSEEAVTEVFSKIDSIRLSARRSLSQIAMPSLEKEERKRLVKESILQELDDEGLEEAYELYKIFIEGME